MFDRFVLGVYLVFVGFVGLSLDVCWIIVGCSLYCRWTSFGRLLVDRWMIVGFSPFVAFSIKFVECSSDV